VQGLSQKKNKNNCGKVRKAIGKLKKNKNDRMILFKLKLSKHTQTLFKLDYSEQFYPNQSFARFENPGVMAQRLISKD
jgi:hypothetical protein